MLGLIPSRYRFDRVLRKTLRTTGEAGWVSVRSLLDARQNKAAQRARARLAEAGKIEVHPASGDLLRLPRLDVIDTVLDEQLYLTWTPAQHQRALPDVADALRTEVRNVCDQHPLATLELIAQLTCSAPIADSRRVARSGLALCSGEHPKTSLPDLCEAALELGVFSGPPEELYATVARVH